MIGDNFIFIYFIAINMLSFIIFSVDKYKAVHNHWRIKERTLFLLAALGGSLGCLSSMKVFRHKTRSSAFTIGMPLLLLFNLSMFAVILFFLGD